MQAIQGTIDVVAVLEQQEQREEQFERLMQRQERDRLRREEREVLRKFYQADEAARQTIVTKHAEVFARLRDNRRKAAAIAKAERAEVDRYMLANGYLIRAGVGYPRYVRRNRPGGICSNLPWHERATIRGEDHRRKGPFVEKRIRMNSESSMGL